MHRRNDVTTWAEALPAYHVSQPEDIREAILFFMANPYDSMSPSA